jgi:hypothetical protein
MLTRRTVSDRCASLVQGWATARAKSPKLYFATLSPAKFAARYGSTEAAIKEWRQDWQQTAEGRLYGGEGADVDGDAPQKTKPSKPTVNVELEI